MRVRAPHLPHQGLAAHHAAGVPQQHAQELELLGGELQLPLALEGAVRANVHPDVLGHELVLVR